MRNGSSPPFERYFRDGAKNRPLLQTPVASFEYLDESRKELRGKAAVGNAMINRQGEIRQRAHDDGFLSRHDTIASAADGEYRGLRWIDERREAVRAFRAKVRDAERGALDFLALD